MKNAPLFLTSFLLLCCTIVFPQENDDRITTFILVRHAEKGTEGSDPGLSAAGEIRAKKLIEVIGKANADAFYSTPYKRTRETLLPVANARGKAVMTYEPGKPEEIEAIYQKHRGGLIVICGHSNTIPIIANWLTGKDELKNFGDNEYGNILIVSVVEKGRLASVTWIRY